MNTNDAIETLILAMTNAQAQGMLYEFLNSFVWEVSKADESKVVEAILFANREWDL